MYDVIVIGAGQAGLAAGYYLQKLNLDYVILEASEQTAGSWPKYYNNLVLFSPVQYSSLPGLDIDGGYDSYPNKDTVIQYLNQYRNYFNLNVQTRKKVEEIKKSNQFFSLKTVDQELYKARAIICATGSFNNPYIPNIDNMNTFEGKLMHSFQYREANNIKDERIVVVGGRNSAVQIAIELAQVANVSIATRTPIKYIPQRLLGKDGHFWGRLIGYDTFPIGLWRNVKDKEPVIDLGGFKKAIEENHNPDQRNMFTRFTKNGVVWSDGLKEHVDTVIFATGYKPKFDYLEPLKTVNEEGNPLQKGGISSNIDGLFFVGLHWQRSHASATLRGVGPDAKFVIKHLKKYLKSVKDK
ncbi:flavin-containing monooxygenase [Piscibacillus halophilus]|uniref:flavin-containing monooxygenase n=1 Tax=Piscibacillus halophilus TaxID=571933 RepID=UPI001589A0B4|nr:NAD(P)/FAD-dependent oxidoreductase [Piscibacillus halophilus]